MRRNQNHAGRSRYSPPRSSRLAWRQGPQGSKQHLALTAPATRTRTQRPRKYLAIHAAELVVEPNFQILRRHRRSMLRRLEHPHRSAVENHVHRPPRLGSRRSLNLRIGIILMRFESVTIAAGETRMSTERRQEFPFGVVPQPFIAAAEHASSCSHRRLSGRPLRKRTGSDGSKLGEEPMRVFPAPAVVLTALAVSRPWVDSTVRSQAAAS